MTFLTFLAKLISNFHFEMKAKRLLQFGFYLEPRDFIISHQIDQKIHAKLFSSTHFKSKFLCISILVLHYEIATLLTNMEMYFLLFLVVLKLW